MSATPDNAASSDKRMRLRYAGTCRVCAASLEKGQLAIFERATKTVRCEGHPAAEAPAPDLAREATEAGSSASLDTEGPEPTGTIETHEPPPLESGAAGSSARREYERRKAKDEARIRERWGRLGGLAVALSDERQTTKAWDRGAAGEERLGARLDGLASERIALLHDRRIPGTRANIDHLAVTAAGVWVIDAKRYNGRPELKVEGGILRPRIETVVVGRRDATKLVDGVLGQVDRVKQVLGEVPVTGVLCFIEADWPLIGGSFVTRGVHVLWPRRLGTLLEGAGLDVLDVPLTAQKLAVAFPSA